MGEGLGSLGIMYKHVLIAIDGSELADRAVATVAGTSLDRVKAAGKDGHGIGAHRQMPLAHGPARVGPATGPPSSLLRLYSAWALVYAKG